MSFKKILIPIDGSVYSDAAIAKGVELAKIAGSEITLFFTIDSSIYTHTAAGSSLSNLESILKAEKDEVLNNGKQKVADAGLTCTVRSSEGIPGREICEISGEYDLIIMGTAGRTGIKKMILGSVTQHVVAGAKCPVMSVKAKE